MNQGALAVSGSGTLNSTSAIDVAAGASITASGYSDFALDSSGYLTAVPVTGDTFADWIAGFSVGGQTGINDDYDNDNIGNALDSGDSLS